MSWVRDAWVAASRRQRITIVAALALATLALLSLGVPASTPTGDLTRTSDTSIAASPSPAQPS